MTDDLVKRLLGASIYDPHEAEYLCELAAVHIEKLEAALREIVELGFWDGDRAMDIARKALEGENG